MFILPGLIGNTQRNCFDKAAGAVTATWNSADKSSQIALSISDTKATRDGSANAWYGVRSTQSVASAKVHFEFVVNSQVTAGLNPIGFGNASGSLISYVGSNVNSFGWASDGTFFRAGSTGTALNTYAVGDVCAIEMDATAELFWGKNFTAGGNWNNDAGADPATGTGGRSFSTCDPGPWFLMWTANKAADALTINTGGSAYSVTPSSGFGNIA